MVRDGTVEGDKRSVECQRRAIEQLVPFASWNHQGDALICSRGTIYCVDLIYFYPSFVTAAASSAV